MMSNKRIECCMLLLLLMTAGTANMYNIDNLYALDQIASSSSTRKRLTEFMLKVNEHYTMNWYQNDSLSHRLLDAENRTCFHDYLLIARALAAGNYWVFKFIDASGKMPPGMSGGDLTWFGSYELCNMIDGLVGDKALQGRYCNIRIPVRINDPEVAIAVGLTLGICVPASCTTEDVLKMAEDIFYLPGISIDYNYSYCHEGHKSLEKDAWFIVSVTVCVVVGTMSLIGSLIDFVLYERWKRVHPYSYMNDLQSFIATQQAVIDTETESGSSSQNELRQSEETLGRIYNGSDRLRPNTLEDYSNYRAEFFEKYCFRGAFLLAFSLPYNIHKLWNAQEPKIRDETGELRSHPLSHLDGVRVLTMAWIMAVHVFTYQVYFSSNLLIFRDHAYKDWTFQAIRNGSFSVDTFFFISALLTSYLLLPKYRTVRGCCKRFGFWIQFAIHRFMRIAPLWFFVVVVFTGIFPYLTDGPVYPQHSESNEEFSGCRHHWWITFLNNWFYMDKPCMLWTWYLSNDYQFSVILAPIFIVLTAWHWALGTVFAIALIISAAVATFVITYQNEFGPSPIPLTAFTKLYAVPYTRWGSYGLGLIAGWLLVDHPIEAKNYSTCRRLLVSITGCAIAAALTISTVFGLRGPLSGDQPPLSNLMASTYAALSRIAFTIGVGIVLYFCATSWTPVIRAILCFSGFRVLARLTFCAYLIHPILILFFHYSLKETINVDYVYLAVSFFAVWTVSYLLSVLISSCTEIPIISLDSLTRRSRKKLDANQD